MLEGGNKNTNNGANTNGMLTGLSDALHSSEDDLRAPYGQRKEGEEDDGIDSFGMPAYVPQYPLEQRYYESVLSVPWHLRKPIATSKCTFFDFLRSQQFWRQAGFALRITLFAVLLPSILIAQEYPNSPFVSTTYCFSAAVLASKVTVGEGLGYLLTWARAGCIWLPLATIGTALHLGDHMVAWCFYYTILLFVMATVTENMVRRICLLLFNSCMIGMLVNPSRNALFPSRVMVDWCIGTGLCLFATFVPYPIFSKAEAQHALAEVARDTGAAFTGMVSCFWSAANVNRNMSLTKSRLLTAAIDQQLQKYYIAQDHAFFEFLFEPWEVRDVRGAKAQLFESLRTNLRGLSRVLDIVEEKPWVVDDPERSRAFGDLLEPFICQFSNSLDKLTDALATAKTFDDIRALHPLFLELNDATMNLQSEFNRARRRLFYEYKPDKLEEFVPLMTFFIFSIINFRDTMMKLDYDVHSAQPNWNSSARLILLKTVWEPIDDNIQFFKRLGTQWRRREIQRVIEAAKVSGAMILTVGFSYLIKIDKESLSGPNIIAFVSGSNPVEAVQASVVRLTACILGTVLGFFAGSYSTTTTDKIASLCTLMFLGTFFRMDKEYGIMAVYAMFVLIPLDTLGPTTTDDTIARMNQNTFGIFIYVLISMMVLPLSPSLILCKKRINILIKVSEALTSLCDLFSEPLPIGNMRTTSIIRREKVANIENASDDSNIMNDVTVNMNMSTRLVLRTDHTMKNLNALLRDIESRLKATYLFMGFAREERGLVEVDYPVKACEKTSNHLYRMICLLKTMWCSWDVIRSQKFYAPETRHIFRILQPIAWDASRSFSRFVDMMCYALRDPSTAMETELMQVVLQFMQAAEELHLRKNQIMFFIISNSVDRHLQKNKDPSSIPYDSMHDYSPRQREKPGAPLSHSHGRRHEESASILPLLRKGTKANLSDDASEMHEKVELPNSFVMPVTSEDAEGLHSFTLSLQMFSEETKMLLMSLEEMLDHSRKKL
ncbi:hypothetical protein DQ04_00211210 [Trypanosoma grayi]|uniref:hypothetical protein n=1 Tax=Trypanosoma grayi TaxID=71804 RepID=UPI0004F4A7F3|nr:hypothetical protein DQ04_00211210 [Trypanosoma grayi]KEG15038.1 hypothetical protein DQ04_00211210 [Trypanosoma grayi]